jgi:hypothetical protein
MYFSKRKQNTKHKYRPKLRRNLAWLNRTTQVAKTATIEEKDSGDQPNNSEP